MRCYQTLIEGLNGANRQPSSAQKINRQPSKTKYFYRQRSNERAKISQFLFLIFVKQFFFIFVFICFYFLNNFFKFFFKQLLIIGLIPVFKYEQNYIVLLKPTAKFVI